jgi:glycosyltransferase involved in cell wall biosynthesis
MLPVPESLRTSVSAQPTNTDTLVSVTAVLPSAPDLIVPFVERTLCVLQAHYAYYELLLIDNGSPAQIHTTIYDLQRHTPNVRLVRLSRRYNQETAFAAALDHSIGDYIVLLDPEDHPPELIPRLVERLTQGCDSVTAVPTRQRENVTDRWVAGPAYRLASSILGFRLEPDESYYKAFSRRLVNSIVRIRSKNRYLSYLNVSVGLRHARISYERESIEKPRPWLRRLIGQLIGVSNLLVSNSAAPLRFASAIGLMASAANMLYLLYIFIVTLVKSKIAEGWLTTSLTQTVMFMALFLIMTILSEYISRILHETKEQPLYFVESESNSTVSGFNRDRLNVVRESVEPPKVEAAGA